MVFSLDKEITTQMEGTIGFLIKLILIGFVLGAGMFTVYTTSANFGFQLCTLMVVVACVLFIEQRIEGEWDLQIHTTLTRPHNSLGFHEQQHHHDPYTNHRQEPQQIPYEQQQHFYQHYEQRREQQQNQLNNFR